jgi:hypothetical protein
MGPIVDGFVYINVTISDLEIKSAIRIGTHPGFVLNRCALAAEIRKRNEITRFAFLTLGEIVVLFQKIHLPTSLIKFNEVYNNYAANGKRLKDELSLSMNK